MMRKKRVYLDTTVFNYYFDTDRGILHTATVKLFKEIKNGKYAAYVSKHVVDELNKAVDPKRSSMVSLLDECSVEYLAVSKEADKLAQLYIDRGAIPKGSFTDAKHIAIAAVYDIDMILSLNFSHIVKLKTRREVNAINDEYGYRNLLILSPMEVIDEEDS